MTARKQGAVMGRPSKLHEVVRTRPDGTPITAAEHICDHVRVGIRANAAAAEILVSRSTLWAWRQRGAAALALIAQGVEVTGEERAYADFLDTLEKAEAEKYATMVGVVHGAAVGGRQIVDVDETVVERFEVVTDPSGRQAQRLVERTVTRVTKTKTLPAQWTAAAWWLERTTPDEFAKGRTDPPPDGEKVPEAQRVAGLGQALDQFFAGTAAPKPRPPRPARKPRTRQPR